MLKINILIIFLFLIFNSFSQTIELKGLVKNSETGEPLSNAHISVHSVDSNIVLGQTISGIKGEFSITYLPAEDVIVQISFLGCKTLKKRISLKDIGLLNQEFSLETALVSVGEIKVSAWRQETELKNIPLPISVVAANQIEKYSGTTPSDVLKNEPGLAVARDGTWATSLNIRGMSEQRILTLIDGNRVETATDVAAGLAMIDVNDIERIEVIKGAASSLYGTGAVGGVVNIITKTAHYNDSLYFKANLTGYYQTVNKMHYENVSFETGDSIWHLYTSGTFRKALNTITPKGELTNSQFSDNNFSIKAGIKPFNNHELKINYQRFYAHNVGIPGGSSFPVTSVATYPKELREMSTVTYSIKNPGKVMEEVEAKIFHQYILRDVRLIPGPTVAITPSGFHKTKGAQVQTNWNISTNNKVIGGIEVWQRNLKTEREKTVTQAIKDSIGNITGNTITERGEVPIPDSRFTSAGLYFQDRLSLLNDKLEVSIGGRFDFIHISNKVALDPLYIKVNGVKNNNPPNQRISFTAGNSKNISWSTDLGIMYHILQDMDFTLSLSRAFRSPSLEERFKYIDLGTTVKIGDPDLKPEEGYFIDMGTRIWGDQIHLTTNVFVNSMRNLIVEIPGTAFYNYSDQPGRTDTIPALINSNVNKALLFGFDLVSNYNIYNGFTIITSASFVRGKDTKNSTNLPLIPPLSGRVGLKYAKTGWFGTEIYANLVSNQFKIASGEKATTGYVSYDLNMYSNPIRWGFASMTIFGGIENLTNRAYINHLSTNRGIIKYEAGRNFYLRVKVGF